MFLTVKRQSIVVFKVLTKQGWSCTSLTLFLPTHHMLEFHLVNWLSALKLSLAKVGDSFPSLMERHSHFHRKADERERTGAPLRPGNRFSSAGHKGRQHRVVTLTKRLISWDGFLLLLLLQTHATIFSFYSSSVCKSNWRMGVIVPGRICSYLLKNHNEYIHWVNSAIQYCSFYTENMKKDEYLKDLWI